MAVVVGALAVAACEGVEQVQDRFRDLTPHEAYEESLARAGLDRTALGRDWLAAGRRAVDEPTTVGLPFDEEGFLAAEEPGAVAYRVTIERGQKLTAEVRLEGDGQARLFVDFLRVPASPDDAPRPVFSSDSLPGDFVHEPWRGGDFILRVQPELLRGGQYRISLRLDPQLAFPVEGRGMPALQSIFGADRDGGRRSHAGVDIFAPRGTPVLAASAGRTNRVGITGLGGKVVWVRDPVRGANIYYAHLDSQYVGNGVLVEAGDTIGFVGNTGNARTTPPHLHFGVYRRGEGPVDPDPFLRPPRGEVRALTVDLSRVGSWVRVVNDGLRLRAAPDGDIVRELAMHTPVRVLAGSGDYYRVRLPDGSGGYVAAALTEPVDQPVDAQMTAAGDGVLSSPRPDAPVLAWVAEPAEMPVFGRFDGFLYVLVEGGRRGWLPEVAQQP